MDQLTAHLDRGWDLLSRGDVAGAMLSAQKSLELDAQSPEAHNLFGFVCAAEGKVEDALEHYRQAIDLDETFVEAMLNAAEVLIHPLQDYDGAVAMVEDALDFAQSDDELADALLLKFDALLHRGDRESATQVVRALPDGPFENPHLNFLIGRAHFELGDVAGSEPRIRAAAEAEPENPDVHYYLGLLLDARGDQQAATHAFVRCRELDLKAPRPPWAAQREQVEKRAEQAIADLPPTLRDVLTGALLYVGDAPGLEVVADGVDPRVSVLLDDVSTDENARRVGRVFVYQRNLERLASGLLEMGDELKRALEHEIVAIFPQLAATDEPETPGVLES